MSLTKEQIQSKAAESLALVSFDVPEFGGAILIKPLTLGEKVEWQSSMLDKGGNLDVAKLRTVYVALAAKSIVDETGTPMFTSEELLAMSAAPLELIISEVRKANRLNPEAVKEAGKN